MGYLSDFITYFLALCRGIGFFVGAFGYAKIPEEFSRFLAAPPLRKLADFCEIRVMK